MGKAIRVFAFFAALLTSSLAWAYDVAVMPVKGVNLQPGQADAIGMILAQEYAKASGYQVAGPDVTRPLLKEGTDFQAAARSLGAGEYIEAVGVKLEEKMILSAERHETNTGKVIHTVSMPAITMDDVPEVSQRLSRALLLKTTPDETRTIETVTKAEGAPLNQTYSVVSKGVKAGLIFPLVSGVDLEPQASIAFELRIEKLAYFIGFAAGATIPADTGTSTRAYGALFAEFSGSYYLSRGNFGPYLGLGLAPRIQIETQASGIGFTPFAHIGATFPRDSRARGFLEFRLAQNVLPIAKKKTPDYSTYYGTTPIPAPTDELAGKYPTEPSVQFGIVF